jgi:hypothetical protein
MLRFLRRLFAASDQTAAIETGRPNIPQVHKLDGLFVHELHRMLGPELTNAIICETRRERMRDHIASGNHLKPPPGYVGDTSR